MKYVIDTSSLISFIRYYLPLDNKNQLFDFIKDLFENEYLILIEQVYLECKNLKSGIILEKLKYLKKIQSNKTKDYMITIKQHKLIDNNWIRKDKKTKLTNQEYQEQKNKFIQSADCHLILYTMNNQNIGILTEETLEPNDNKLFYKIPKICGMRQIKCISLPNYFKNKIEITKI